MKAKHENVRPKTQPADSTPIPTATPHEPPKRAKPVKGHLPGIRPYVAAHLFGRRVMILDRVQVTVVLEDPFADRGAYPIELSFAEFENNWTYLPTRTYVASEYERLGIKPPPDRDDRITTAEGLRAIYATMLRGAAAAIEQKLQELAAGADITTPSQAIQVFTNDAACPVPSPETV